MGYYRNEEQLVCLGMGRSKRGEVKTVWRRATQKANTFTVHQQMLGYSCDDACICKLFGRAQEFIPVAIAVDIGANFSRIVKFSL